jgi:hypothetical protein
MIIVVRASQQQHTRARARTYAISADSKFLTRLPHHTVVVGWKLAVRLVQPVCAHAHKKNCLDELESHAHETRP